MTPERCPGCGTKLEPDMLACPNCPMSFPDAAPESAASALRHSRYYDFLLPALFFAALGAGVWMIASNLMRLGQENGKAEISNIFRDKGPAETAIPAGGTGEVTVPGPDASGSKSVSADAAEGEGSVSVEKTEPETDPAKIAALEPRTLSVHRLTHPAKEWRFRGKVYDLVTLKPLGRCALAFKDEQTNRTIRGETGADGLYKVVLPPLIDRGYVVTVACAGYARNYLNPGTEGVPQMNAEQRREMAKDLSATLTSDAASIQAPSETPIVTDFYLAPRR